MNIKSRIAALALTATFLAAGTAEAATRVYVRIAPPPVVVERHTLAPHPNYVWQSGYHRWSGTEYAWVPGTWVARPHTRATWVEGRWRHNRHGYYWDPGHWR